MDVTTSTFWAALGAIVMANIVLSGDNAVVIAMAARSLPPRQQKKAILWGSAAAVVMRVGLTVAAVEMLRWPWLKVVGALLLLYVGTMLLGQDGGDAADDSKAVAAAGTLGAIRTILVADLVMSLDNVLAVAAAANGNTPLLVIGLAVSIPLIVFGSTLLLKVMERFPVIITVGAGLLGWLAGEMLCADRVVTERFGELPPAAAFGARVAGAATVLGAGGWLRRRRAAHAMKAGR